MSSVALTFDLAYVASKDLRIQALFAGTLGLPGVALDPATRYAQALALAVSGLQIDQVIDASGADPYYTMLLRQQDGYTTVPTILQGVVTIPPGVNIPGEPAYNPALYSIKVSTNPADFPPFTAPAPPAPPQGAQGFFGVFIAPGYYFAGQAAINAAVAGTLKANTLMVNPADNMVYTFVASSNPMGAEYFWKLINT